MSNAIATQIEKPMTPEQRFNALVRGVADQRLTHLATTPAGKVAISRVAQAFIAAAKSSPRPDDLFNCDPASVGACMILSAEHGLFPGGPSAPVYLIPKAGQLLWWINHRGILELAKRAGLRVRADVVYAGDAFRYTSGSAPTLMHEPAFPAVRTWDTIVGSYAVVVADDGAVADLHVLTRDEIEKRHKSRSQAPQKSWTTDPAAMCLKAVLKAALTRGVILLDSAGQSAMEADADSVNVDTTVEQVPARPSIPLPPSRPVVALPPPSLDVDAGEPTEAQKAAIRAEEAREAGEVRGK